jgi:hypothetical protein
VQLNLGAAQMPFGMGFPKTFDALRSEPRVPMEVAVRLTGDGLLPGTEATFTENVSSRGARILSSRRWKVNDHLTIATLTGSFRSTARVAYCLPQSQAGFAVGVEFLEPTDHWVVSHAPSEAALSN